MTGNSTLLGNDRISLVGSNYGSWRIRADEGGPKWLTDSDVSDASGWRFGGGLPHSMLNQDDKLPQPHIHRAQHLRASSAWAMVLRVAPNRLEERS